MPTPIAGLQSAKLSASSIGSTFRFLLPLLSNYIVEYRPDLDIERVATGEYWHGPRAKELGLVDELGSSDDYLMQQAQSAAIYAITYKGREGLVQKLQAAFAAIAADLGFGSRVP